MGIGKRGKRMEKGRGGEGSPPSHFLLTTLTTVGLCETTLPTNKQYRCIHRVVLSITVTTKTAKRPVFFYYGIFSKGKQLTVVNAPSPPAAPLSADEPVDA